MTYYFAYGSNMNHEQMRNRCPGSSFIGPASLAGYRLVFDGCSSAWAAKGVANIIPEKECTVWGGLYTVTAACITILDKKEGVKLGSYYKKQVPVRSLHGKSYEALVYCRDALIRNNPSAEYRKTILIGAENCHLPVDYIQNELHVNIED